MDLKELPLEFSKPFAICFDFLAKANISIYEQKRCIRRNVRSLLLIVCYVTFYISMAVSFSRVCTGELGFYELANLLPIIIVATQVKVLLQRTHVGLPPTYNCNVCLDGGLAFTTINVYFSPAFALKSGMKGIVIMSNLEKARTLIDGLGSTWRTAGLTKNQLLRKDMMLKRLNLCNAVFYWMNIVGTWQYILVPLFETLFRTFVLGEDKQLFPFICTFPFEPTQNWLVYLLTYFYESYSMLHLIYMYLGVEFLMITLCSHLATEFELLREELLHARPSLKPDATSNVNCSEAIGKSDSVNHSIDIDDDIRGYDDKTNIISHYGVDEDDKIKGDEDRIDIKDVIKRHQKLIELTQLLDDIFNKMIFFNLLFATITICFFGFVAKIARDPPEMANNFVGVVASMIPIFNLCYYAEMLSGASAGVAESAYHNLWYEGDLRYQKIIIFIIVRSQKPCSLTSMRYSPVTLNTFTTVLSTTWSYFSLAISVYETDKQ